MTKRKKYWQYRYQLWVDGVMIVEIKNSNQNSDYENITAIRRHYKDLIADKPFEIYKVMPADPDPVVITVNEPLEVKPALVRPLAVYSNQKSLYK